MEEKREMIRDEFWKKMERRLVEGRMDEEHWRSVRNDEKRRHNFLNFLNFTISLICNFLEPLFIIIIIIIK